MGAGNWVPVIRVAQMADLRREGGLMPDNSDIPKLSFEKALSELEGLVRKLEEGDASLDGAIEAYERGALLKRHCQKKLDEAKARVDKITVSADGSVTAESADME